MATSPQNTPVQPVQRPGLIIAGIRLVLRAFGVLIASLLFSILIEFAGLLLWWGDQSWRHSQAMLTRELSWLGEHFKSSLILRQPVSSIMDLLDAFNHWLLVETDVAELARQARGSTHGNGVWGWISALYMSIEPFVLAAGYVTATFVVRLTIVILSTPLFLMASLTGFIDGLMRRDLRKFGAGRESSFIYHRAKRAMTPLLILPGLVYLSLPFSLNPMAVFVPSAVALGVTTAITAATFKKYL